MYTSGCPWDAPCLWAAGCVDDAAVPLLCPGPGREGSGVAVRLPCRDGFWKIEVVTPGAIGWTGALGLAMLASDAPDALRCIAFVMACVA